MRFQKVISALTMCLLLGAPAFAGFPGEGDRAKWQEGEKYFEQSDAPKAQKQFATAIHLLTKAINTYPYDAKYWASRADCFNRTGEYESAEQDSKQAIALSGGEFYHWAYLAEIYFLSRKFIPCNKALNTMTIIANGRKEPQYIKFVSDRLTYYKRSAGSQWPNLDSKNFFDLNEIKASIAKPIAAPAPAREASNTRTMNAKFPHLKPRQFGTTTLPSSQKSGNGPSPFTIRQDGK